MIMKVVSVIIITLFFNIDIFTQSNDTMEISRASNVVMPSGQTRIEKLLQDNSGTISENIKKELMRLKSKTEKFEVLTQEEVEYIRQCELDVIKAKLGEAQFEEYCKLITKREGNGEFLPPERYRLYELEKQLNDIR